MKLTKEEFKKLIFEDENTDAQPAESVLNSIDNKYVISEATKLNKTEEAITDPKELEPIIKKWEDALAGNAPINNAKTGQPLSKKYCQDKLRVLKKKMASLQSGEGKDNSKNDSTEKTPTLSEVLKNNGWSGEKNTYKLSTDKYNYEIKLPTTNESQFINLVRKLILEETSTKLEVKITDSADKKEVGTYKIDYTTDYTKIEKQLKEIISNADAKKDDKKEEAKEKHILDIINSAYDKLTDDEKYAFDAIYGEKLTNALKN